jgi:hypothetical protein
LFARSTQFRCRGIIGIRVAPYCASRFDPRSDRRRSMLLGSPQEAPQVQVRDGRVIIAVGWDDADRLHEHFRRRGLPGTVSLDPTTREAALELWDKPDVAVVDQVLGEWLDKAA